MGTYWLTPFFLLLSREGFCYVFGPIEALATPISTEAPGRSTSSSVLLAKLIAPAKLLDRSTVPDTITYTSRPDSRRESRPPRPRLVLQRRTEISHIKVDSSAIIFPATDDDPRFTTRPFRYPPFDDVTNTPSVRTGQHFPPRRAAEDNYFSGDDDPTMPAQFDDRVTFDGPTSSEKDNAGGRRTPPIRSFPREDNSDGGRPGWVSPTAPSAPRRRGQDTSNVPNWAMNNVERPRVDITNGPEWQGNLGGMSGEGLKNIPNWQGNWERAAESATVLNVPNRKGNGGRTSVGSENAPTWQGNRTPEPAPPTSTIEPPETTTPECECPMSSEYNPVCAEVDEERITFINLSEFKCANICTQTEFRLMFHSSCGGAYSNLLYPLHQYTTDAPAEQASASTQ